MSSREEKKPHCWIWKHWFGICKTYLRFRTSFRKSSRRSVSSHHLRAWSLRGRKTNSADPWTSTSILEAPLQPEESSLPEVQRYKSGLRADAFRHHWSTKCLVILKAVQKVTSNPCLHTGNGKRTMLQVIKSHRLLGPWAAKPCIMICLPGTNTQQRRFSYRCLHHPVPANRWLFQKQWFTMLDDFLGHPEPNPSWILFFKVGNW